MWDYINRGMPLGKEETLKPDEVYALTAYLLFKNGVIKEDDVMDETAYRRLAARSFAADAQSSTTVK